MLTRAFSFSIRFSAPLSSLCLLAYCKSLHTIRDGIQPNFGPYHLKQVKIPLPPGEIQNQIVAQIEQEQKRVQATQELVEIFEQKIKDKIAEVWGTDITPNDDNNASSNGTSRQPQPVQRAVIEQAELGLA